MQGREGGREGSGALYRQMSLLLRRPAVCCRVVPRALAVIGKNVDGSVGLVC